MGKVKAAKRKLGKPQGFAALDASNARSLEPLKPTHAPSRGVVSAPAAGTAPAATRAASAKPLTDPEEVWEMGKGRGLRLNDAQVEAIHAVITGGAALPHSGVQAGVAVLQAVVSQLVAKAADGPQSAS